MALSLPFRVGRVRSWFPAVVQLRRVHTEVIEDISKTLSSLEEPHSQLLNLVSKSLSSSSSTPNHRLISAYEKYTTTRHSLISLQPLLSDPDLSSLAQEEASTHLSLLSSLLSSSLPSLLLPPSSTSSLGCFIELKAGVGGSEAALFASDLVRMYLRLPFKGSSLVQHNNTDNGGIKDGIIEIPTSGSYDMLRFESGVHRVQRVPLTETSGRTHTSTVSIVVLPLIQESSSMEDDLFKQEDVKVEVMRARGAGGQHVNKTESAVRLTHIPTGITVSMQDERSQHQNRRRAYQVLRSRLLDIKLTTEMNQRRDTRRNLVKGADRSEKIRTYNYPQDRVTDHRIGLSVRNLTGVMQGDALQLFLDALQTHHQQSLLQDLLLE